MRVPSYHCVPGNKVFEWHSIKECPSFTHSAIFGVGRDHTVPGDGVAIGHGGEDLDGFFDPTGPRQLGKLEIFAEEKAPPSSSLRHGSQWRAHGGHGKQ